MGLLSDLFGKDAENLVKSVIQNAAQQGAQRAVQQSAPIQHDAPPVQEENSYWDVIPAEENLFNFNGPYFLYFEKVFTEEFPQYRVEREAAKGRKAAIFTFWDGARKALVVEVMGNTSTAKKLRADCQAAGIPYLRYYYGHWGWWNTRSYVVNRTRTALGG